MPPFFTLISWHDGFAVVTPLAAVLALFTARLRRPLARWVAAVLVPVALAGTLFGLPLLFGHQYGRYETWGIYLLPWALIGTLAALVVTAGVRLYVRVKAARGG